MWSQAEVLQVWFWSQRGWLPIQVNPPLTACVTLNGTLDLCYKRVLSPPKEAERKVRQRQSATLSLLPWVWEKSGWWNPERKAAKLWLIMFSLWNNPCVSARMMWRFFERQTWRENVITFSCTCISRQCPFKIKKALEGYKGGSRREMKDGEESFVLKCVTFHQSDSLWEQLVQMSFSWDNRKQKRQMGCAGNSMTPLPLTNHSPPPKSWFSGEEVRTRHSWGHWPWGGCRELSLPPWWRTYPTPGELHQQQSPGKGWEVSLSRDSEVLNPMWAKGPREIAM